MIGEKAIEATVDRVTRTFAEQWGPAGLICLALIVALVVNGYLQNKRSDAIAADLKADREKLYTLLESSNKTNGEALKELVELKVKVPAEHGQQLTLAQNTHSEVQALRIVIGDSFREIADVLRQLLKNEGSPN